MEQRTELKKLVCIILKDERLPSSEIYREIKEMNPGIIKRENVSGFRGFAKIISSFEMIRVIGKAGMPRMYALKEKFK